MSTPNSRIFVRYKTLGYVSNNIPVSVRYINRRKENLFVTSVGKSIHTYGCSHFTLLSVGPLLPEDITCITSDTFMVFAAAGREIYAIRRGTEIKHVYKGHETTVHCMLAFGPHLISIDEGNNLKVWDIKSEELHTELFIDEGFKVSYVMHPSTYVNKILMGSEQGQLQLWNIHTSKLIYTFNGWGSSVNVIEQAPAQHIVGVGLKNGMIILHNLQYDESVMKFTQDWGPVTSLTFRTDGHPIMISGSTTGHLTSWNLEAKQVVSQVLNAHWESVTGLQCLQSEPLMVSSSPDNSLKLWIFDMPDGGARLLRLREGHSLPPTYIRFHGSNGHNLLSSGGDSTLRIFNTITETFNKSLGRASYNRKVSKKKNRFVEDELQMPPIVGFTSETTREKEWDNIAALHLGLPNVTTWSYDKLKMGDLKLLHDRFVAQKRQLYNIETYRGYASSIAVTHCGNFVVIGYSTGHCDRFNMQSGLLRCTYGVATAHDGCVRGTSIDTLNQYVITGGSDKKVKWWSFKGKTMNEIIKSPLFVLDVDDAVTFFISHHENSLICAALEDFSVIIIDSEARNVIRRFEGHAGRITDAAFNPDSRWLVTCSMDCCVYTWDIPSGCLIDQFKVSSGCTSLTFSPTGEYLATTHTNYLGIFLWSNKSLYSHIKLQPITLSQDLPLTELDTTVVPDQTEEPEMIDNNEEDIEQISKLITLSSVASSRWQNILSIDLIQKRNKPKEPPKTPEPAPFFLPTIPSLTLQFDIPERSKDVNMETASILQTLTSFGKTLLETIKTNDFSKSISLLTGMGPATLDYEVRSLPDDNIPILLQYMKLIEFMFVKKTNFELAHAYLALFLKVHGKVVSENETLCSFITVLQTQQAKSWQKLQDKLFYNLCVLRTLKS